MADNNTYLDYENVNGVKLSLKMVKRSGSPNSRQFTISYKSDENKSSWPMKSLFLSIIFNIIALTYVRINLTVILIIIIVLSFLVFFWITHSVQSESLLVIPTVGIQSSVKYVCGREDNFVPWSKINDVVINEVIKMNIPFESLNMPLPSTELETMICLPNKCGINVLFQNRVLYYLTVLVQSSDQTAAEAETMKLIPLFKYTKPRLLMLEKIYSELQTLLIDTQKQDNIMGSGDIG